MFLSVTKTPHRILFYSIRQSTTLCSWHVVTPTMLNKHRFTYMTFIKWVSYCREKMWQLSDFIKLNIDVAKSTLFGVEDQIDQSRPVLSSCVPPYSCQSTWSFAVYSYISWQIILLICFLCHVCLSPISFLLLETLLVFGDKGWDSPSRGLQRSLLVVNQKSLQHGNEQKCTSNCCPFCLMLGQVLMAVVGELFLLQNSIE